MTLISAYKDLFILGEKFGGNVQIPNGIYIASHFDTFYAF